MLMMEEHEPNNKMSSVASKRKFLDPPKFSTQILGVRRINSGKPLRDCPVEAPKINKKIAKGVHVIFFLSSRYKTLE